MTIFTSSNFKKAVTLIGLLACSVDAAVEPVVDLKTAGDFAILTATGVTTTGVTSVTGDIGTSPIASTAITGFGLTIDPMDGAFSTSSLVTGEVYASDYTSPTPSKMTTANNDMQAAFTDAAGRSVTSALDFLDVGAGNVEGKTLPPGVYKWGTGVEFTSSLTFNGTADDVWILQIEKNLIVGNGAQITLLGGAQAKNIFWQIAGFTTLGATSHVEGIFLCKTKIVFETGSSMNGAALSQTAVTLDAATIVKSSSGPSSSPSSAPSSQSPTPSRRNLRQRA